MRLLSPWSRSSIQRKPDLRITFVVPGLTLSGGVRAVIGFANGLGDRGHRVTILTPRVVDQTSEFIDPRVKVVRTTNSMRPAPGRNLTNVLVAFDLAMHVPRSDVLVATYTPTAIPVLLASAAGRGEPCWLYGDYLEMFEHRPVERFIIQHLAARFHHILTYSHSSVDEIRRLSGARATVVGVGLDSADDSPRISATGPRPSVALYVGDRRPRKGLSDFLDAVRIASRHVPDLSAVIATKDDEPIECPIPFQRFVRPTNQELGRLYRECGVFVSTSWFEGLGLPPLEAMSQGAPVVVTDQRGSRDYATDEINSLVVPIKSPNAVARAIVRVLTDPMLAERLVAAAFETASYYRWDDAITRFEQALGLVDSTNRVSP